MKKLLFIIAFLFASVFAFSQGFGSDNSKSMKPIMNSAYTVLDVVETQKGYEFVRLEFDIIKSDAKESYRVLTSAYTYRVGVMGDNDKVETMSIQVYKRLDDGTYEYVTGKSGEQSDFVDFTPTSTGYYKFVISATFKLGYGGCHYCLMVLHE